MVQSKQAEQRSAELHVPFQGLYHRQVGVNIPHRRDVRSVSFQ